MACAPMPPIAEAPILDVKVHLVDMEQTLRILNDYVRLGGSHHVVTLDASMCVAARHDPELRAIVQSADLVTPDSAGVLWALKRAGFHLKERVSGVEIVERLCANSAETGISFYFLGSAPGVAEQAGKRAQQRFPGCRIVGCHDGYFTPQEEPRILEEIRAARPDVLCVALGIPKQEKWIARHRHALQIPVMIGVGGTLDVLSGRVKRAPTWVRRLSLEWLYRLARNPRKISKVLCLPRFVAMVLAEGRRYRP
ncbi:MAG: WecB/TagA/CpsF family glycosyltransferase [Chthonomonadales bacterium]